VRKTLIALAATTGLIGLGTLGATAAPIEPIHSAPHVSAVQQADWYCGPRCQYWRHRRWEARHDWWYWHRPHPYYGYNYGNYYYR